MTRLDRYVMRNVLALTGLVGLVLVSIYSFVVFVSDLGQLDQHGFGPWQLLQYTVLLLPGNAYILMPIVVLLGTLLGLGNMARQGELTAMRAAGVSWTRIGGATLVAGVLMGGLGFALGNWLGPAGQHRAETLSQRDEGPGRSQWLRDGDDVLRVQHLLSADAMDGVTLYRLSPDGHLLTALSAAHARYQSGQWLLQDVRRSALSPTAVTTAAEPTATWSGHITPSVLQLLILKEDALSAQGLSRLVAYLDLNHLDDSKYRLLLWRRLVEPFSLMVMMMFAVPFTGGRMRDVGAGQRLLVGILIGVLFYVSDKVSVSLGQVYGWWAPLAAGGPTVILATVAAWRLSKMR